ncbi:MAG: hypothetical protein KDA53_05640 [Hyphomonas sp.]|nr:hypothetical protein [Hyphomonas sp.]
MTDRNKNDTISWYFQDAYRELVDLVCDPDIYGDSKFDEGYVSGLRSVLYLLHQQAKSFDLDLKPLSGNDFDVDAWYSDPAGYVKRMGAAKR